MVMAQCGATRRIGFGSPVKPPYAPTRARFSECDQYFLHLNSTIQLFQLVTRFSGVKDRIKSIKSICENQRRHFTNDCTVSTISFQWCFMFRKAGLTSRLLLNVLLQSGKTTTKKKRVLVKVLLTKKKRVLHKPERKSFAYRSVSCLSSGLLLLCRLRGLVIFRFFCRKTKTKEFCLKARDF